MQTYSYYYAPPTFPTRRSSDLERACRATDRQFGDLFEHLGVCPEIADPDVLEIARCGALELPRLGVQIVALMHGRHGLQIGRASCRERGEIQGDDVICTNDART